MPPGTALPQLPLGGPPRRGRPVLLHGEDGGAWPVLRLAAVLGLATRIGIEDTLLLPDGRPATGNAQLVATAKTLVSGLPGG
ncbi:3-keto-5-aminohexanoate cleavage protein [Streptomyces decoyicus]